MIELIGASEKQLVPLIICQFHALVTMCHLYSIGLAGEENRKCRVSRAFDYMSI